VLFGGAGTKFAPASGGPPLAEAVETLKIQVEALNPQFVDDVSAKISNALKKLGEVVVKNSLIKLNDNLKR
jgi:hypothetical protein